MLGPPRFVRSRHGPRCRRGVHRAFRNDDVRAAVHWLLDNGYMLAGSQIATSDWSAALVYSGDAEVHVGVERSQWYLDIAPAPGEPPIPYDLLVAAQRAQTYWDCFPGGLGVGLPGHARQLPPRAELARHPARRVGVDRRP